MFCVCESGGTLGVLYISHSCDVMQGNTTRSLRRALYYGVYKSKYGTGIPATITSKYIVQVDSTSCV